MHRTSSRRSVHLCASEQPQQRASGARAVTLGIHMGDPCAEVAGEPRPCAADACFQGDATAAGPRRPQRPSQNGPIPDVRNRCAHDTRPQLASKTAGRSDGFVDLSHAAGLRECRPPTRSRSGRSTRCSRPTATGSTATAPLAPPPRSPQTTLPLSLDAGFVSQASIRGGVRSSADALGQFSAVADNFGASENPVDIMFARSTD